MQPILQTLTKGLLPANYCIKCLWTLSSSSSGCFGRRLAWSLTIRMRYNYRELPSPAFKDGEWGAGEQGGSEKSATLVHQHHTEVTWLQGCEISNPCYSISSFYKWKKPSLKELEQLVKGWAINQCRTRTQAAFQHAFSARAMLPPLRWKLVLGAKKILDTVRVQGIQRSEAVGQLSEHLTVGSLEG